MRHTVIVGGFASSERQMKRVSELLSERYDNDVTGASLRQAMDYPLDLDKLLKDNVVVTHSAGLEAIRHTHPAEIAAITPALITPRLQLVARAGLSGLELLNRQRQLHSRHSEVNESIVEIVKEFGRYAHGHMKHLGRIASSDAFKIGIAASEAGIPTDLAFARNDRFFQPCERDMQRARDLGVRALWIPGCHERFIYDPVTTMNDYDEAVQLYEEQLVNQ